MMSSYRRDEGGWVGFIGFIGSIPIIFGVVMSYVHLAQAGHWWWWLALPVFFLAPVISGAITGEWWVMYTYAVLPAIAAVLFVVDFAITNIATVMSKRTTSDADEAMNAFIQGRALSQIREFSKAIEIDPSSAKAYIERGYAYLTLEEYDHAIADYSKIIELDANDTKAYFFRGFAYVKLGKYEHAVADYSNAIKTAAEYYEWAQDNPKYSGLKPNYAELYYRRGIAYAGAEQYEHAIEDYSLALSVLSRERSMGDFFSSVELTPSDAEVYNDRGMAYVQAEQYGDARADYERAIERNPNHAEAHRGLALAWFKLKQYENAAAYYTKAIKIEPNHIKTYCDRGEAYYEANQYGPAKKDFKTALRLAKKQDDEESAKLAADSLRKLDELS